MKKYIVLTYVVMMLMAASLVMAVDFSVSCGDIPAGGGDVSCTITSSEEIKGFSATVNSGAATLESRSFGSFIDISDPPTIGALSLNPAIFAGTLTFQAANSFTLAIEGITAATTSGNEDANFPVVEVLMADAPDCTAVAATCRSIGIDCPDNVETSMVACSAGQVCNTDDVCVNAPDAVCGNGVLEGTEECDDGNNLEMDGCTSDCLLVGGYDCPVPGEPCVETDIPEDCGDEDRCDFLRQMGDEYDGAQDEGWTFRILSRIASIFNRLTGR